MRWPVARHWFRLDEKKPVVLCRPAGNRRRQGDRRRSAVLVEQESPVPPGGLPKPSKLVVTLSDNHLQYALAWYGLAGVLVISFIVTRGLWLRGGAGRHQGRAGAGRAFRLPCEATRFSIGVARVSIGVARVGARRRFRRAPKLPVNQ